MKGRHLFIPLESNNKHYYASCNILNDEGLMYVYLLHPMRGSLIFTLVFDEGMMQYKPRHLVPGLDKNTLKLINDRIHNRPIAIPEIYDPNYRFIETGEGYGYLVINRLFVKDADLIGPTGKFHVFHEEWEELSEYEWDIEDGCISSTTTNPAERIQRLVNEAIQNMRGA